MARPKVTIKINQKSTCAPDAIITFDGLPIATVPCGDVLNLNCSQLLNAVFVESTAIGHQHGGVFVLSGTLNGKDTYEKSDDPDRIITYDGTKWVLEKLGGGAHTHDAADGNEDYPWEADWSLEDITMSQATIAVYCDNGVNCEPLEYTITDSDSNVLYTGFINPGDTLNQVIQDADVRNSDSSWSDTVLAEGLLVTPDIDFSVNSIVEGSVPSVKDIDIELEDSLSNPITPTNVTMVGDVLTIEMPSGGAVMNVDFSADKVTASQGETITFTDLTDNSPTHWGWFFGSEGSSLLQNPTFKFREIGLKNVKLFAANATSGGFDLKSNYIEIKALLDIYTTAAAAYSLRKLRTAYTGSAIRVRRASDNTEQDIGFTSEGFLNTSALVSFVGFSDGFVTTWYDQSGNSRNMTQSTGLAQAKIVTNGTVIRDASEPALEYNDSFYSNSHQFTQNNNLLFLTVLRVNSQRDANPRYCAINSAANSVNIQFGYNADSKYYTRKSAVTNTTTSAFTPIGDRKLLTHGVSGGTSYFSHNGALQTFTGTGAPTADSTIGDGMFLLKGFSDTTFHVLTGKIQEVIIYDNDKLTDRAGIETNINDYYNVF